MTSYIVGPWLIFFGGFATGWISLLALVWAVTAIQRRRNRRPQ